MATEILKYTPLEDIISIHDALKVNFRSGKTKSIEYRKQQLSQLAYMIKDNTPRFEAAFAADLGRPALESHLMEISICLTDAVQAYNNVEKWVKTEKAPWTLNFGLLGPKILKEPKGVVLIISPFNYPAWLCLGPLTSAIAAGNAAVIKPSESVPTVSSLLAELFPKYLDSSLYRVVNGAVPETTKLLELHWDHIMYTGNSRVARIVAAAAAKHLTPLTLELGGKSPVFVDPECDMALTARRIAWGKFVNAGQSCTSPDYILIPAEAQDRFIAAFTEEYNKFYPEGGDKTESFARIVSDAAFNRLKSLLDNTKGEIILGGQTDAAKKFIAPTLVRNVVPDDALMSMEIFGPILPIVPVQSWKEALDLVNSGDHPLVIYAFSKDEKFKKNVFDNTTSGAAVSNEVVIHPGVDGIPFGGVGESGYGQHTGKYGFDTFTQMRPTIHSPKLFDVVMGKRYPPYTPKNLSFLKKFLSPSLPPRVGRRRGWRITTWLSALLCVTFAVGLGATLTGAQMDVLTFMLIEVLER